MESHKDLKVWQESMDLVMEIYELTESFPRQERYSLIDQMRRSAVSVPSNIAEGAGRNGKKEWIRFIYISLGSLSELETQLEISLRLNYIKDHSEIMQKIKYIRSMLSGLIRSLSTSS